MSNLDLMSAIKQYAEECNLTRASYDPRRIINKSPYPWGQTQCPPMILLFQYFDETQINTFLEKNITQIEGSAFSTYFTTSSGLSPTKINALSVAKDKGYYRAYMMGVGRLDEDSQKKYLRDIQDIFKKFISDKDNHSIFKYIRHVPKNIKFNILGLRTNYGQSLLYLAIQNVNTDTIQPLLDDLSTDQKFELLNTKDNYGYTPLYWAVVKRKPDTVKILLDGISKDQKFELLSITTNDDWTLLYQAVMNSDNKTVSLLLDSLSQDEKFELLNIKNNYGNKPIELAIRKRDNQTITLLLDGLSPQQKSQLLNIKNNKLTKLFVDVLIATWNKNTQTLTSLLESLSQDEKFELLKIQTNGWTLLYQAVVNRKPDTVKILLDGISADQKLELLKIKANDAQNYIYDYTPLYQAVKDRKIDIIKLLLDGISPDQKFELLKISRYGWTPLFEAVYKSNTNAIEFLLEGLSSEQKFEMLKIQSYAGWTPLYAAEWNIDNPTIELLLEDLTAQHRVSLQLNEPKSDYQVPDSYQLFLKKNIDITKTYDELNELQQSDIDDNLPSIMAHNTELLTSHIIPSYQKMKRDDLLNIHNNSKVQLLGMIENLPKDEKSKHSDLINELKTSIAKQDFTQEESHTFIMQDMSDDKIKDSSHYKRVEALRFIDQLTMQSSTAVSTEQLSTLIDHAITELTQDLPEKAALKAIWKFRKQFSSDHLKQLEKLLFNVKLYRDNPSSEKPDPSSKSKPSFTSKVSEGFSIQSAQSMIKDIVQSLQDPSSNTPNQPKN